MKKLYSIEIKGNENRWVWYRWGTPQHEADWRADGLKVEEIMNIIPEWVVNLGLTRAWVMVEDFLLRPTPHFVAATVLLALVLWFLVRWL